MITKEEIVGILRNHSGYIDRSMSEQAVHEDNFKDVSDAILSKLHQPTVSESVCDHDWRLANTFSNQQMCSKCYKRRK
jgi:hypothetical protein